MRTAKYETAAAVLKQWQSGDGKVIMKVQYNPKSEYADSRFLGPYETTAITTFLALRRERLLPRAGQ